MAGLSTWGEALCMKEHRVEEGNGIHEWTKFFSKLDWRNYRLNSFFFGKELSIKLTFVFKTCDFYMYF